MTKNKPRISTRSRTTTSSFTFTNAEKMKNNFFANAENRRKAGDKAHGDAGYWNNGRCNWGGTHNLQEDCEALAQFFNRTASITDDINEIKLSANEQTFNQRKQAIIAKVKELSGKCQVSNSYSIANICCIWNDYFGSFLKPFLNEFAAKLNRNLKELEKLEPKHQKELLDLEAEARAAESAYKENLQKSNDPNLSESEKAEFIVLANRAAQDAEKIKQKLKRNPLVQVGRFNYLDDLKKLSQGNVPDRVSPDSNPRGNISGNNGTGNSNNNNNSNPLENPQTFWEQNKKMIVVVLGLLGLMFYVYTQKDIEDEEEIMEDKKFMRQMALMKAMKEQ